MSIRNAENGDVSPLLGRRQRRSNDIPDLLDPQETTIEYRNRWWSIRVVYFIMFMNTVTITITIPSLWPYLKVLSPDSNTDTLGWVAASFSLGQMVASPFFGGWANARKSSKEPILVCNVLACLACVFYSYLASIPDHRVIYLILARCLLGLSTGVNPVIRSYISAATTEKERTGAMANVNIFCSLGFIVGPVLQSVLVPVSYPGPVEIPALHLNMYTLPSLLAALFAFINALVAAFLFKEYRLFHCDDNCSVQRDALKIKRRFDYIAVFSIIVTFFIVMFLFTSNRTINPPLAMHMFAWSKAKTTFIISLITCGMSVQAIVVYQGMKWISKRIEEKYLLMAALVLSAVSYFALIPWGDTLPPLGMAPVAIPPGNYSKSQVPNHMTFNLTDTSNHSLLFIQELRTTLTTTLTPNVTTEPEGCPWNYQWCRSQPAVNIVQFGVSLFLYGIALPASHVLTFTIFSKVLGPIPQGLWMGLFAAAGSLAGMIGPIVVTIVYDLYGPRWAFTLVTVVLTASAVFLLTVFHRLKPYKPPSAVG